MSLRRGTWGGSIADARDAPIRAGLASDAFVAARAPRRFAPRHPGEWLRAARWIRCSIHLPSLRFGATSRRASPRNHETVDLSWFDVEARPGASPARRRSDELWRVDCQAPHLKQRRSRGPDPPKPRRRRTGCGRPARHCSMTQVARGPSHRGKLSPEVTEAKAPRCGSGSAGEGGGGGAVETLVRRAAPPPRAPVPRASSRDGHAPARLDASAFASLRRDKSPRQPSKSRDGRSQLIRRRGAARREPGPPSL